MTQLQGWASQLCDRMRKAGIEEGFFLFTILQHIGRHNKLFLLPKMSLMLSEPSPPLLRTMPSHGWHTNPRPVPHEVKKVITSDTGFDTYARPVSAEGEREKSSKHPFLSQRKKITWIHNTKEDRYC